MDSKINNSCKILFLVTFTFAASLILHGQVAAIVCSEFFTATNPPVFLHTGNPFIIALVVGTGSGCLIGVFVGFIVAIASNLGKRSMFTVRLLIRPLFVLVLLISSSALLGGVLGYALAVQTVVTPDESIRSTIHTSKHAVFIADAFSYRTAGLIGLLGTVALIAHIWRTRSKI